MPRAGSSVSPSLGRGPTTAEAARKDPEAESPRAPSTRHPPFLRPAIWPPALSVVGDRQREREGGLRSVPPAEGGPGANRGQSAKTPGRPGVVVGGGA